MRRHDVEELLQAYDRQLRARIPERLPHGVRVERDGPLVRLLGEAGGGFVGYRDLAGAEGDELDELIARQVRLFADRGERFEWKLHGHDLPGDLPERLLAAGFVAEETETVVIAPVGEIAAQPELPDGVTLREVSTRADLDRIEAMERAVWNDDGIRSAASLHSSISFFCRPVLCTSAANNSGLRACNDSTVSAAKRRFSAAMRLVYKLLSTTVVYSSGPVTP